MAHHHHTPEPGILSLILAALLSIWTSIEMEVKHGVITLFFAIASCIVVFFIQRFLKKKFP
jgi:hypothetical protein